MGNTFYLPFEPSLMEWLQTTLGDSAAVFLTKFSFFGEEAAMLLILGFFYWGYNKKLGIRIGSAIIIGVVLNPLIKNIALRRRPYFDHPGVKCLRPVEKGADIYDISAQGYSFPSGHSMNGVIAYGSLAYYLKKNIVTIAAVIIALLVGISRIVAGVHYPTDVFVGWLVGILVVFAIPALYDKFGEEKKHIVNLAIFLISCIGIIYCRTTDYFTGMGLLGGLFLSEWFEEKYVNFKETKNLLVCGIRIIGGGIVYLISNTLLKLPFSKEFLESPTMGAFLVRMFRYCIVVFLMMGVYPIVFKFVSDRSANTSH